MLNDFQITTSDSEILSMNNIYLERKNIEISRLCVRLYFGEGKGS